jgi:Uma2 family endonuclease
MVHEIVPQQKPIVAQSNPPGAAKDTLPTMYDLPSEVPEEPGLPDEYHYLQPQLLSTTLRLSQYAADQVFSVGDMNLYYDVDHPLWYKRPDWFAVVGVPRLYAGQELRLSYVVWQERVNPFVVVELLSPGTEQEDLGQTAHRNALPAISSGSSGGTPKGELPPTKWEVYEQILRIPYYVLFDRYTNRLRAFHLVGGHYQAMETPDQKVPISEFELSLGVWQGNYQGVERPWLRWYTTNGPMVPTDMERAEQAEDRAERLAQRLRELGLDPDTL